MSSYLAWYIVTVLAGCVYGLTAMYFGDMRGTWLCTPHDTCAEYGVDMESRKRDVWLIVTRTHGSIMLAIISQGYKIRMIQIRCSKTIR
jgi:hypothetical protein